MREEDKVKRQKEFLIGIAFWTVWVMIAVLFLKVAGSVLLPFVIAFIVAYLLAKPVDFIAEKTNIRRSVIAVTVVLALYAFVAAAVYFVGNYLLHLGYDTIYEISYFLKRLTIPFAEVTEKAGELVSEVSGSLISGVSSIAAGIPGMMMKILIAVIATVFMEVEFLDILAFLKKQIPQKHQKMLQDGKLYVTGTLGKCLLSYCLIFGMTYLELCAGLLILQVDGAVVIAFLIAVLDILPVLGTGTVLIPWSVLAFVMGNIPMGVGILLLYLIITVVRNIVEPKLVGRQMGLSPVVMLPCMLIGLKFFGIIGLFLVPLAVSALKSLNDKGIICIFRT